MEIENRFFFFCWYLSRVYLWGSGGRNMMQDKHSPVVRLSIFSKVFRKMMTFWLHREALFLFFIINDFLPKSIFFLVRHAREQSLHQVGAEKPINRIGCGFFYQQKNEHFKDDRFHRPDRREEQTVSNCQQQLLYQYFCNRCAERTDLLFFHS